MFPLTIGDALISGLILGYGHKLGSQVENVQDMTKALLDNLPDVIKVSQELREKLQLPELRYRPRLYERLTIDLSTARSKEKYDVTGSYIIAQSIDGELEVRFNEQDADPVTIDKDNRTYEVNFDCLYITNSAQSEKSVTFLIGKGHAFAGSSITPVDITAQSIEKIAVDIIAQSVEKLSVDVVAQTIEKLSVDLVAQTLEKLSVDITAQTLEQLDINIKGQVDNLLMDIKAQSVGISLKPVWAAEQDEDLNLTGQANIPADTGCNIISYQVPAGKILYVGLLSYGAEILWGYIELREGTSRRWGMNFFSSTFSIPIVMPFITPHKFVAGEHCNLYVYNDNPNQLEARGNLSCWLVPS